MDWRWKKEIAVVIRENKYMIGNIGNKDGLEIGDSREGEARTNKA